MTDPTNPTDAALAFAIDLDDVRDRIKAIGYFVNVEDIRASTEILSSDEGFAFVPPAAFVSVASEKAQRDKVMSGASFHAQRVDVTISVLFAEAAVSFNRGADDQVERTRKAIIRQLIFWTPKRAAIALQYQRYLLRATGNGLVWGEVLFNTSYRLTT